jgi:hypothetical protein
MTDLKPAREPFPISPEMAKRVGWDFRHDAIARLIRDEFALMLPRDAELIRQLALLRVQQGDAQVIPFGKYRGYLLEEVFVEDPSYLEWLASKDWFRAQFERLHAAIVSLDQFETEAMSLAVGGNA